MIRLASQPNSKPRRFMHSTLPALENPIWATAAGQREPKMSFGMRMALPVCWNSHTHWWV